MKKENIALLYFTDSTKPAGKRFLGEAVIAMKDEHWTVEDAAKEAWRLGINPGGTAIAYECHDDEALAPYIGKLLDEEQAIALGLIRRRTDRVDAAHSKEINSETENTQLSSDATVESVVEAAYERAKDHAARGGARGAYPGERLATPVLRMKDPTRGYTQENVEVVCLAVLLLEEAGFPIEEVVEYLGSVRQGRGADIVTDDGSTAGSAPDAAVSPAGDRLRPEDSEGGGKMPCP